jgi:predicted XRE-type DNA-binding protein
VPLSIPFFFFLRCSKILGVQQSQVSLLMRNRAGNFSIGRLMEFLTALRQDVEITVRPARKERGALSVTSV